MPADLKPLLDDLAAESARFAITEVKVGRGAPWAVPLPLLVPPRVAMEILLTGDPVTAQEALAIGLINRVVPHAELIPTARAIAERICRNGPLAVRSIKQAVIEAYNRPWEEAFAIESKISGVVLASDDAKEGPRAFAEKREPRFTGH